MRCLQSLTNPSMKYVTLCMHDAQLSLWVFSHAVAHITAQKHKAEDKEPEKKVDAEADRKAKLKEAYLKMMSDQAASDCRSSHTQGAVVK